MTLAEYGLGSQTGLNSGTVNLVITVGTQGN